MPHIEVSEEALAKIKELLGAEVVTKELDALDDLIGQKYLFRTVTYHMVGLVKKRIGNFLVLDTATWVADSKRFNEALSNGFDSDAELEYAGNGVLVNLDSVVDAFPWKHALPTTSQ